LTSLVLILSFLLGGQIASAQTGSAELSQFNRLQRMQERIGAPGTGLLARYGQSLKRLENTLDRGEYQRFSQTVQKEIITPWLRVDVEGILDLVRQNQPELTSQQQFFVKQNGTELRRIHFQMRRVRRLLTRVEKEWQESRRWSMELRQLGRRYQRQLDELEKVAPERARIHRDWFDGEFAPRLDRLNERERQIGAKADQILSWTESPELKRMISRLREVTRALDGLNRQYDLSRRR